MARSIDQQEKVIRKLVEQLTGFQENEENFSLCVQYAISNLKYHRFLSVDSHKVTRNLQGVCEKFRIHSESLKDEKLKELSQKFLESPIFEGKDHGKTDTHYSILSFLLLVAERPVRHDYIETPKDAEPEVEEQFDWGAYLLEGVERYEPDDDELSDWTDEDDTLEENQMHGLPAAGNQGQQSARVTHPNTQQITPYMVSDGSIDQWEESDCVEGADWLTRNLVAQYWRGEKMEIETGKYNTCKLNEQWVSHKKTADLFYSDKNRMVVTELVLLREVVWMLMGLSKLYLLEYNGRVFMPRPGLCVPHLTDEALQETLAEFTRYGSYVKILHNFMEEYYYGTSSTSACQTYQSFTTTIADFLCSIQAELSAIEHKIIKQEETVTLLTLARDTKPLLRKVGIVFVAYMRGIHQGRGLELPSQQATLLLTTLYNMLVGGDTLTEVTPTDWDVDGSGDDYNSDEMVLLPMWLQTIQPYINIIDTWISQGNMRDPCAEFIIHRNKNITTLDGTYWEKSFAFHTMSKVKEKSPSGGHGPDYTTSDWAPKFLQPVLQQIVLTGKSMEMLEGLGKLAEHDGKSSIDISEFQEGHLYDKFLTSLQTLMGDETDTKSSKDTSTTKDEIFSPDIDSQMREKGTYDIFLKAHFEKLLQKCEVRHSILEQSFTDTVKSLELDRLQPLELILQECLYPHIVRQYERVCRKLVTVMQTDYSLMGHLARMRNFFLMESGDTMFKFYTQIFDKIRLHDHWKDSMSATWALHEALELNFPDELSRLAVLVEGSEGQKDTRPISITNCVKLHCVIPSPVDVVINERCQQIYNQIFCFLLQIKHAKYALDELRFCELSREHPIDPADLGTFLSALNTGNVPRSAKIHSMHLLRMRLINFTNSLHNYIMTRILHSTGLEFAKDLETVTDLDQIIEVHAGYVSKIHERCLLHRRNKFLKEAVLNMLNLALRFQREWDQGIDKISAKTIDDMITEFSRCIQFLSSFLRSVLQRGSFPHLESLALGFQNLIPR